MEEHQIYQKILEACLPPHTHTWCTSMSEVSYYLYALEFKHKDSEWSFYYLSFREENGIWESRAGTDEGFTFLISLNDPKCLDVLKKRMTEELTRVKRIRRKE